MNPNTNTLFNLFWFSFTCAHFYSQIICMPNCLLSGFLYPMCLKAVLFLALCIWQVGFRPFWFCSIYVDLTRLFAFLFSLANFHFLKSIFYLQLSPVLLCLIMYVVLRSRNTGDLKRQGKKGYFWIFQLIILGVQITKRSVYKLPSHLQVFFILLTVFSL